MASDSMQDDDAVELEWNDTSQGDSGGGALVGRLVTSKPLNKSAVRSLILRSWNTKGQVNINEVGEQSFLFNFERKDELNRIIRDSPWTVMGFLLVLDVWTPLTPITDMVLDHCAFWIQFHGLPREGMSRMNCVRMGARVGTILAIEDPVGVAGCSRGFVRVRVMIDLKNPLMAGFWVPRSGMHKIWVLVRYKKLQHFCYSCSRVGHDLKSCRYERLMSKIREGALRYNADFGTTPIRPLTRVINMKNGVLDVDDDGARRRSDAGARGGRRVDDRRVDDRQKSVMMEDGLRCNRLEREVPLVRTRGSSASGTREGVRGDSRGENMDTDVLGLGQYSEASEFLSGSKDEQMLSWASGNTSGGPARSMSQNSVGLSDEALSEAGSSAKTQNLGQGKQAHYFVEFPVEEDAVIDGNSIVVRKTFKYEVEIVKEMKKVILKRNLEFDEVSSPIKKQKT